MDHHPCPQTGCGGLRAPCVIRSPGGHGASGDDGLQVLWWFWGFSVGGEKVPSSAHQEEPPANLSLNCLTLPDLCLEVLNP